MTKRWDCKEKMGIPYLVLVWKTSIEHFLLGVFRCLSDFQSFYFAAAFCSDLLSHVVVVYISVSFVFVKSVFYVYLCFLVLFH